jgi:threonine dehydrogenase-like Zn-dependent dehydrogenase
MIAQSLWHISRDQSELRSVDISRALDLNQLMLHTDYSLISTGTEKLVSMGRVPESLYNVMGVPYMDGEFTFPIKYGYSTIGTHGDQLYHVMHPHQDAILVQTEEAYALSEPIPGYRATLISNVETTVNAIWDADLQKDESIAICGYGNIGSLLSLTLRHFGYKDVSIIEPNAWRQEQAEQLGFDVISLTDQVEYDLIFHTSANEQGLQYCIDHLNPEGRVIELSWYGNKKTSLNLGGDFHYKRLKLISSQVSQISPLAPEHTTYLSRKQLAERVLTDKSFDQLISDFVPFDQTPAFYNDLRNDKLPNGLIWIIKYN